MTKEDRSLLRQKIASTIVEMEGKLIRMEENVKPISPENSIGRVSRMDAINNKSVSEAALRSAKRKLSSLKFALTKVDEESFGNCTRCRRPIQPARLMYMPESTKCVRCAD